jgi:hypothetical protein
MMPMEAEIAVDSLKGIIRKYRECHHCIAALRAVLIELARNPDRVDQRIAVNAELLKEQLAHVHAIGESHGTCDYHKDA